MLPPRRRGKQEASTAQPACRLLSSPSSPSSAPLPPPPPLPPRAAHHNGIHVRLRLLEAVLQPLKAVCQALHIARQLVLWAQQGGGAQGVQARSASWGGRGCACAPARRRPQAPDAALRRAWRAARSVPACRPRAKQATPAARCSARPRQCAPHPHCAPRTAPAGHRQGGGQQRRGATVSGRGVGSSSRRAGVWQDAPPARGVKASSRSCRQRRICRQSQLLRGAQENKTAAQGCFKKAAVAARLKELAGELAAAQAQHARHERAHAHAAALPARVQRKVHLGASQGGAGAGDANGVRAGRGGACCSDAARQEQAPLGRHTRQRRQPRAARNTRHRMGRHRATRIPFCSPAQPAPAQPTGLGHSLP